MDDLSATLSQILSDPESMAQLQNAAKALGLGGGPGPGANQGQNQYSNHNQNGFQNQAPAQQQGGGGLDLGALSGLLGALGGGGQQQQAPSTPTIDPKALNLIQGAMGKLNSNDKNVVLLQALRPHFSSARQSKVDDAIRLIQLFSLLPVLRDSGLLSGLFGGGDRK